MFSKSSKPTSLPLTKPSAASTSGTAKLGTASGTGLGNNRPSLMKPQQPPKEEQKMQEKTGFTTKPSSRFTSIKTVDVFATSSNQKTNSFAYVYNAGGIPCRVNHGSVHMYVQWNKDINLKTMPFDPLLATCFEGLIEDKHPYNFIAFNCIKEMLEQDNAGDKIIPMIGKLAQPLRNGLLHANEQNFENSLDVLKLLSDQIGPNLNPHIKNLLQPIVKKMNKPNLREKIFLTLRALEENGGSDVLKIIKSCIPTYTNV